MCLITLLDLANSSKRSLSWPCPELMECCYIYIQRRVLVHKYNIIYKASQAIIKETSINIESKNKYRITISTGGLRLASRCQQKLLLLHIKIITRYIHPIGNTNIYGLTGLKGQVPLLWMLTVFYIHVFKKLMQIE